MSRFANLLQSLDWTVSSIQFTKRHVVPVFSLGLVAAIGRAVQLKALGSISPTADLLLEIGVESVRIALFLYALGAANMSRGVNRLRRFLANGATRNESWRLIAQRLRRHWPALIANVLLFAGIAFVINAFIDHIAYETCLYIALKTRQLLDGQASEWVLILFFKNLSVIPFTLIVNAFFCLWLVNRLPEPVR